MPPTPATAAAPPSTPVGPSSAGLIAAAVAVTAWGGSGVITKWLPMGALAISVWRFGIYAVLIGGLQTLRGARLSAQTFRRSLLGGLLLAVDVALFFTAVKLTSIVNATIIGSLQPLLLTAYGVRFLGERVTRRDVLLGAIALIGVVIIVTGGDGGGAATRLGDLAAVGALAAWSSYFIVAKKVNTEISPTDFTIAAAIIVALANAPLAVAFGQSLAWPGLGNVTWLVVMAIGAGVLGHNLMNWALPRVPLWLGSTFTLLVPVVSSAIAWVWLDEPLTAAQIAGMTMTVAALAVLVWYQQTQTAEELGATSTTRPAEERS